jgi:hypothetical protein
MKMTGRAAQAALFVAGPAEPIAMRHRPVATKLRVIIAHNEELI